MKILQKKIYVDDWDVAEIYMVQEVKDVFLEFDTIILKNYFLECAQRSIINCNSSYEKFVEDMENYYDDLTIFNNIGNCTDQRIIDIIANTTNLLVY